MWAIRSPPFSTSTAKQIEASNMQTGAKTDQRSHHAIYPQALNDRSRGERATWQEQCHASCKVDTTPAALAGLHGTLGAGTLLVGFARLAIGAHVYGCGDALVRLAPAAEARGVALRHRRTVVVEQGRLRAGITGDLRCARVLRWALEDIIALQKVRRGLVNGHVGAPEVATVANTKRRSSRYSF